MMINVTTSDSSMRIFIHRGLYFVSAVLLLFTCHIVAISASPLELWYDAPATRWIEALPIGNGRMGAMVFGGVESDRYQFNEDTLWTGGPHNYTHRGAAKYLPQIRQLLLDGKQREAERLAAQEFMSIPLRQMAYQPFGDVELQFAPSKKV